jgi:hypothetical protein
VLNKALRELEAETIINMGFFMHDLHHQIKALYQQQIGSYHGQSFIVYRGQGLPKTDFNKLTKNKNGLMSFNNFLSTSTDQEMARSFAAAASTETGMVGILYKITVDPSISSFPFASIREASFYKTEEEILFSMHTVFRIGNISELDNNNQMYEAELRLTADDDQQLRTLTEHIREESDGSGWEQIGVLLIKIGRTI